MQRRDRVIVDQRAMLPAVGSLWQSLARE